VLKVGDTAPEIDAETTDGSRFVLSQQQGLCTVVYFFPKAFTPGCTRETATFRDNFNEILLAGANLVGVSTDDGDTQCRFAEEMRTSFPLIADHDKGISRSFGVLWPLLGVAKRVTYVIGEDRKVLATFRHEVRIDKHRNDVLSFVNQLFEARRQNAD
jgi:peroxiredoxin